eukprot:m.240352 g.240352  ORF g.240352 m.240352 type:complete len:814 (+) comp19412_c0_seq2:86-2527(+)
MYTLHTMTLIRHFSCCAALLCVAASADQIEIPLYKQVGAPIPDRVADLVQRMTLDEKINQLVLPFGAKYPEDYVKYNKTGLGATYPLASVDGQEWWQTRNDWQRWAVNSTRLGIPTSFISETLHSGYSKGTIFPMPCLQGSSWNTELVGQAASIIALEASASGVDRGFSPVLHFCTDPRFGRCEEAFGEDPALLSTMGVAAVTGLSGPGAAGSADQYIADPTSKIATEAKHYAAYGFGGRDGSMPAEISDNTLFDVYLKPWRAYAQAGGRAIMAAHNEVSGMPCHGNKKLLTALRETFGFGNGLCASDAGDIGHIEAFGVAGSRMEAGAVALRAGMDQELDRDPALGLLPQALAQGLVNMSDIDRATGNVLRQKFASGLFDGREDVLYVDPVRQAATLDAPAHRSVARQIAEEGITLLKNDYVAAGAARLPLVGLGKTLRHVAIIGPNADNAHSTIGGYTQPGANVTTVLQGAITAANESGNAFVVEYSKGTCLGATPNCSCPIPTDPSVAPCGIDDTDHIPPAVALAAVADVTVLVLGDSSTVMAGDPALHHETGTCGEHFDRDSLDPPGAQMELLTAVLNVTKNVIVVLIHGRTVTFGASRGYNYNAAFDQSAAVLAAWRPGEEAGTAVWNILNGTVNPSGRTAHTWPRTVGQVHQYVPWFLEKATRSTRNAYADMQPATPLVPFGFGLSYSNFSFSNIHLSKTTVNSNDTFAVKLDIANVGPAGKVVVQVYFSQALSSRVRFAKMLLGFKKISVAADSTLSGVSVNLRAKDFEMWDTSANNYVVESSNYTVYVGQYSTDPHLKTLTLSVV